MPPAAVALRRSKQRMRFLYSQLGSGKKDLEQVKSMSSIDFTPDCRLFRQAHRMQLRQQALRQASAPDLRFQAGPSDDGTPTKH